MQPVAGRQAIPPRLPTNRWCIYESLLNGQQCTNDYVEYWRSKFQKIVSSHHQNICKALELLKSEQEDIENPLIQGLRSHVKPPINKHEKSTTNYRDGSQLPKYMEAICAVQDQ
jgi:hypothetical protein